MDQASKPDRNAILEEAREHVRNALALCDSIGESAPACYLQHGLDLLESEDPSYVWKCIAGRTH